MYLHHHQQQQQHHCYHYHGYKYQYQYQRAIQGEGLGNLSPRSTFELTFVFFAMFVFRYIVMFYANCLISAWNDHHRDHTHQLWKTTGLNSTAIASLPVFTHGVIGERDLGVTIDCVVCFSTVEEGERVKVLPNCRHSFHVACIDIWLRLHSTCPFCRGSV